MAAGVVRYQIAFNHDSGISEDRAVNTFHFNFADDTGGPYIATAALIDAFYDTLYSTHRIAEFMSENLTGSYNLRAYRLADPEPRVPKYNENGSISETSPTSLPEEVACCLSYQAVPTSGVAQARRRGRLFIGPLGQNAQQATTDPRPSTIFQTNLREAAGALLTSSAILSAPWSVYSRVLGTGAVIVGGWTDNAFDTQRRRGPSPTLRTAWPA